MQLLPSQLKFISAINTGRLRVRMGRQGLFITILMLNKVFFFLLSHLSLTPSKPAPCIQVLDCWSVSGISTFALCIAKEKTGRINLRLKTSFFFIFQYHLNQGNICNTKPHFCLFVVHANTVALFNWDACFCCALRGFSELKKKKN